MQYRRFGRTEIQMPVISTGGMRFQDGAEKPLAEVDPAKQANLAAILDHALANGMSHIETARGYGCSERMLGAVLPGLPRERLIVQTKVPPAEDPDQFTAQVLESLERLQLDHVDLLGLHGVNNQETLRWAVGEPGRGGGCLAAARELQRLGKVRHVGFSTHAPLKQLLDAIHTETDGGFDYVNLHYYYIFQRNAAAVAAAAARDMGVFIISPSDKGGQLYDAPPKLTGLCAPLHPIEFNNLWTLNNPAVHTLSLGAARVSDYDLALSSVAKLDQRAALLPPIEQKLAEAMATATGEPSPEAFSWDGVPEHYDEPHDLNLPIMLWLRSLVVGWDLEAYGRSRYNMMGHANHWFPGRKAGEVRDVPAEAIAASVKDSPWAERIPGWVNEVAQRLEGEAGRRLSDA